MNIPLTKISAKLNGFTGVRDAYTGRFKTILSPSDIRGLVLRSLIYEFFYSLGEFAAQIGMTRSSVHNLIYNPKRIKIKPELEQKISNIFGIQIKLKKKC